MDWDSFALGLISCVGILTVIDVLSRRTKRQLAEIHDRRQRRIGWGYGYGQGVVDGRHGVYDPAAPYDGRERSRQQSRRHNTTADA